MRSQNFTYAIEIRKKAIVAATKIMSRMVVFSVVRVSARAIAIFGSETNFWTWPVECGYLRPVTFSVSGTGGERRGDSDDSNRYICSEINRRPASDVAIRLTAYTWIPKNMYRMLLPILDRQSDQETNQESDC